jgi:hypothetical protein
MYCFELVIMIFSHTIWECQNCGIHNSDSCETCRQCGVAAEHHPSDEEEEEEVKRPQSMSEVAHNFINQLDIAVKHTAAAKPVEWVQPLCELCGPEEKHPAIARCVECGQRMCTILARAHPKGTYTKSHKFEMIVAPPREDKNAPLRDADFKEEKVMYFPYTGTPSSPRHNFPDFEVKFYVPKVFAKLRESWGVDDVSFSASLKATDLQPFVSNSKSGAFFCKTGDSKYMLKTINEKEVLCFMGMMERYYIHMTKENTMCPGRPNMSFLTRFFGMYKIRFHNGRHTFFF